MAPLHGGQLHPQEMELTVCYKGGYAKLGVILDMTMKMRKTLESLLRI